ncbi:MAG TPA: Re/Si-specific NAD(P)(+) transhydrogenase subunit alpha [Candidatus Acidoferrales bacterium]|nr:Re/Si-specific NAD(P)(+) transhydrogenase subunit alpha [Candidatus Acidoferrales bacterium]
MRIAVPKETAARENRVALIPETAGKLVKSGNTIVVETGAGVRAGHADTAYREAGTEIAPDYAACVRGAEATLRVREPSPAEIDALPEGSALLGLLGRGEDAGQMARYAARRLAVFSLHALPRTSRAQKMDALSSMAACAGYKAVLVAANATGKFFPLLMTAAGTVAPARVFVLGAGVAGLQAIATARRLGAVVEAFDVRPAVKEEVQSLGATFVDLQLGDAGVGAGGYAKELDAQRQEQIQQTIAARLPTTDVVISTASIPGKRAPLLIPSAALAGLKPGSVIVDLAAESGGNCAATRAGETVVVDGVTVIGPLDLAATLPTHASQMYSRNLYALLQLMIAKDGRFQPDFADDIVRDTCITRAAANEPAGAGKAS